ncbi:lipoyl protein ligase domain-containing protein [Prosthecomicrobium pneumaticum]|uniref:Lipoate-protein ligase A n=1 Tax=Prosthecomicrobium pneumaticum TaxID=81895 RepID=A0A7W9FJ78_9HYPH|nr:protein ligase [Prosthecomicrobium pneumaticum]MBB5751301.1 lipoate-protein ligase A [Prosthecomicrobium pneumaticum]
MTAVDLLPDPATTLAATAGAPFRFEAFDSLGAGLEAQQDLARAIGLDGGPVLLAWTAPRGLIVGRADTRLPHFEAAVARLAAEGWSVIVRRAGGSACPASAGTLQIALARAVGPRATIDGTYQELVDLLGRLFAGYGLAAEVGEKPDAFCPGRYDMSVGGRKLVGIAQHWRQIAGRATATTAATLLVEEDGAALSRIVDLFYETAGGTLRCAPEAVGSLRAALPATSLSGAALLVDIAARLEALTAG